MPSSTTGNSSATSSSSARNSNKKTKNPILHFVGGGCAGLFESTICHPLDTIKTRMQLQQATAIPTTTTTATTTPALRSLDAPTAVMNQMGKYLMEQKLSRQYQPQPEQRQTTTTNHHYNRMVRTTMTTTANATTTTGTLSSARTIFQPPQPTSSSTTTTHLGPIHTARRIIQKEGFLALYKGLTAVYTGIIPKMAIRFLSFEQYKEGFHYLVNHKYNWNVHSTYITFTAGLASGLTEAILVVTPAEVCKIRMQTQYNPVKGGIQNIRTSIPSSFVNHTAAAGRKYTNVFQTATVIMKEEGISALYKGVVPTMLRQGCNQAVNFTVYTLMKKKLMEYTNTNEVKSYQSLLMGGISGGIGPIINNPLDVVKTRMQKQIIIPGQLPKYTGILQTCILIVTTEHGGILALWKGITPRLLRIMPGQAITFMTYEAVTSTIVRWNLL